MRLFELQQPAEITELEQQLDQMFMPLGLDVRFTQHFQERLLGRERNVTIDEILQSFSMLKQKYKKRLLSAKKKEHYEAILKDFQNEINTVFSIEGENLTLITVKAKDPDQFIANVKGGDELKVGSRGVENEEVDIMNRMWYDNSNTWKHPPQAPPRNYTGGRNT